MIGVMISYGLPKNVPVKEEIDVEHIILTVKAFKVSIFKYVIRNYNHKNYIKYFCCRLKPKFITTNYLMEFKCFHKPLRKLFCSFTQQNLSKLFQIRINTSNR